MRKQLILGFIAAIIVLVVNHQHIAFGQTVSPTASPLTSPQTGGVGGTSVPGAPATGFGR